MASGGWNGLMVVYCLAKILTLKSGVDLNGALKRQSTKPCRAFDINLIGFNYKETLLNINLIFQKRVINQWKSISIQAGLCCSLYVCFK